MRITRSITTELQNIEREVKNIPLEARETKIFIENGKIKQSERNINIELAIKIVGRIEKLQTKLQLDRNSTSNSTAHNQLNAIRLQVLHLLRPYIKNESRREVMDVLSFAKCKLFN